MNVANTSLHHGANHVRACPAVHPPRLRSEGILSAEQASWFRANGMALAFDPLQSGWVAADCLDDLRTGEASFVSLGFRPWRPEDAAYLARMLSSERLWQFLPESFPGAIDAAAAAQLIELAGESHHHVVAVTFRGQPIGQARLLFAGAGEAEISYWLSEDHWGKGYGSRIVSEFTEASFKERPELARLFAKVHGDNIASRRVLEKAGYCQSGSDGDWLILERRRDA